MQKALLFLTCSLFVLPLAYSQCSLTAPTNANITATGMTAISGLTWSTWATAPTGCPTTGTSISNGSTISGSAGAGGIFYVPSGTTVSSTLSMGSSSDSIRIIVCGGGVLNLTRSGSVNSTRVGILVMPGGTLRTASSTGFPGKHWLYGAYVPSIDFTIQDANTKYLIAATGIFQMASNLTTPNSLTLNSSSIGIYCEGAIDVNDLYLNSAPAPFLCINSASACVRIRGTYGTSNSNDQMAAGTSGGLLKLDRTSGSVSFNNRVSSSSTMKICTYGTTQYCRNGGGTCCTATCTTQSSSPFPNAQYNTSCGSLPSNCNIPLGTKLLYFKAKNTHEGIVVRWETAGEDNTESYRVERSKDGRNWTTVGTANDLGSDDGYGLIDHSIIDGYVYYRLIEVEKGGKETILATDMVEVKKEEVTFRLFPNPNAGTFTIEISEEYPQYSMEIIEVTGKLLGTYKLHPGKNVISDLGASGVYIASLKINNDVRIERVIVQK